MSDPVYALPLDVFRILAGLVSVWYFARLFREAVDFSSPDGVIDHRLSLRIFPPTRLGFFQPGLPPAAFRAAFVLAWLASWCVVLGYEPRWAAALMFVVAMSTYRWNVLVVYIDDGIMHLVLFWLMLLPIGQTLTLPGYLGGGAASFVAWKSITVPGTVVWWFTANLALAYLIAGLYKWTSPMWRNGSALFAILKLPVAHWPDGPQTRHLSICRALTFVTLVIEPLFALIFFLPANSIAKWALLVVLVGFHAGILATLKIPFANVAMLGALVLAFHDEIMLAWLQQPLPAGLPPATGWSATDAVAMGVVGCLTFKDLWEVGVSGRWTQPPLWKTQAAGLLRNPACVVLWIAGIAQSYRLFDWIDVRNYHFRYVILESGPDGSVRAIPSADVFPRTLRHLLLQSYLHGNVWMQLDAPALEQLRHTLRLRYARRYARRRLHSGTIDVWAITQRISSDNLALERGERRLLVRFRCVGGHAIVDESAAAATMTPAARDTREQLCAG